MARILPGQFSAISMAMPSGPVTRPVFSGKIRELIRATQRRVNTQTDLPTRFLHLHLLGQAAGDMGDRELAVILNREKNLIPGNHIMHEGNVRVLDAFRSGQSDDPNIQEMRDALAIYEGELEGNEYSKVLGKLGHGPDVWELAAVAYLYHQAEEVTQPNGAAILPDDGPDGVIIDDGYAEELAEGAPRTVSIVHSPALHAATPVAARTMIGVKPPVSQGEHRFRQWLENAVGGKLTKFEQDPYDGNYGQFVLLREIGTDLGHVELTTRIKALAGRYTDLEPALDGAVINYMLFRSPNSRDASETIRTLLNTYWGLMNTGHYDTVIERLARAEEGLLDWAMAAYAYSIKDQQHLRPALAPAVARARSVSRPAPMGHEGFKNRLAGHVRDIWDDLQRSRQITEEKTAYLAVAAEALGETRLAEQMWDTLPDYSTVHDDPVIVDLRERNFSSATDIFPDGSEQKRVAMHYVTAFAKDFVPFDDILTQFTNDPSLVALAIIAALLASHEMRTTQYLDILTIFPPPAADGDLDGEGSDGGPWHYSQPPEKPLAAREFGTPTIVPDEGGFLTRLGSKFVRGVVGLFAAKPPTLIKPSAFPVLSADDDPYSPTAMAEAPDFRDLPPPATPLWMTEQWNAIHAANNQGDQRAVVRHSLPKESQWFDAIDAISEPWERAIANHAYAYILSGPGYESDTGTAEEARRLYREAAGKPYNELLPDFRGRTTTMQWPLGRTDLPPALNRTFSHAESGRWFEAVKAMDDVGLRDVAMGLGIHEETLTALIRATWVQLAREQDLLS